MKKLEAIVWGCLAFTYYSALACYRYTWVFASGDSGDWLASAKMWFVPQPYGSPLYISLAKIAGLFPHYEAAMTFLSIVPASIAVGAVYQSVKNLSDASRARIAGYIMLGATVFTTQSVVIEEYALAVMFLSLAILAYTAKRGNLVAVCLGLGCAVHIIMFPISAIFAFAHYKTWRGWIKTTPLFLLCGAAPYLLIAYLMWADTPRWISDGLSLQALNSYLGTTGMIGRLSLAEAPERLFYFVVFILVTFGVAVIPAVRHYLLNRRMPFITALFTSAVFALWLYLTNMDWTTWTYIIYAVPPIAVLAALRVESKTLEHAAVVAVAVFLVFINLLYCNANLTDILEPIGTRLIEETKALPDGSLILTARGGFYTLGLLYAIGDGKDIELAFLTSEESLATVRSAERPVYYVDAPYDKDWSQIYELRDYSFYYKEVTGVK